MKPISWLMTLAMTILAIGSTARAQYAPTYYSHWVCETYSRGLTFYGDAYDERDARAEAINACAQDRRTDNYDCKFNVTCRDEGYYPPPPPPPRYGVTCTTWADGQEYSATDSDGDTAQRRVLSACTAYHNRAQCLGNLRCN